MQRLAILLALAMPVTLSAQARSVPEPKPAKTPASETPLGSVVRFRPDPAPPRSADWELGAARMMPRAAVAAQWDSVGLLPLGAVGDSVTIYLFPNGHTLASAVHAKIAGRRRFDPPASWRAACDNIAHPGWFFDLKPGPGAAFTVVLPGVLPKPIIRPAPPAAKDGAFKAFMATADSAWIRYSTANAPPNERRAAMLWWDFFGDSADAGWRKTKLFGVHGPNGADLAVFTFWLHDDPKDGSHNTTGIWIVDDSGRKVAGSQRSADIYGTVNIKGVDAIVTSSGLIQWNGSEWRFPTVYDEEPCLAHRVMTPPTGSRP